MGTHLGVSRPLAAFVHLGQVEELRLLPVPSKSVSHDKINGKSPSN